VNDNFDERVARQVLHSPSHTQIQMRALQRIIALVAGKVNDRNTSSSEAKESAMKSIQQTLDDAAYQANDEAWKIMPTSRMTLIHLTGIS
jgi:hypothetical protein